MCGMQARHAYGQSWEDSQVLKYNCVCRHIYGKVFQHTLTVAESGMLFLHSRLYCVILDIHA